AIQKRRATRIVRMVNLLRAGAENGRPGQEGIWKAGRFDDRKIRECGRERAEGTHSGLVIA
ncbi:MAG: hypothetical protein V3T20_04405, partial [Gemmatimonadota bacterium]